MKITFLNLIAILFIFSGCAVLHHVQLGNIDNRNSMRLVPIEIKVSETGIALNDVKAISKIAMNKKDSQTTEDILQAVQYFQMGPHTGAGVYSIDYIKNIQAMLQERCTNGKITNVTAMRETRKYPVISGEIVKIKAYCAIPKGA